MSDFTEADAEAVMTPRYRWVPTTDGYPIPGGGTVVLDSEWLAEHDQAMRDRWLKEASTVELSTELGNRQLAERLRSGGDQ
jgi:hypothetical protein